jgi:hypothetical protein
MTSQDDAFGLLVTAGFPALLQLGWGVLLLGTGIWITLRPERQARSLAGVWRMFLRYKENEPGGRPSDHIFMARVSGVGLVAIGIGLVVSGVVSATA